MNFPAFKSEESSSIGRKKILIVDDNSDLRKLIVVFLKRSDYDTVEAATGLEAIEQARATQPDLILMDLSMPVLTGDEAMARLKADPSLVGFDLPAGDVLYKPFHLKSLHDMVQRHLSVNHPAPHGLP